MTTLDATGSALVYSTYLGGSGDDAGFGIAVDADGNAYVIGQTYSEDFPTTAGAFDTTFSGGDAFVTKLGEGAPPPADADGEGVPDTTDNCPATANPGQEDVDGDGIGDACDPVDDRTPEEQLNDLIDQVEAIGLEEGQQNSLLAKVDAALQSLARSNTQAACGQISAFINEVQALFRANKLSPEQTQLLIAAAENAQDGRLLNRSRRLTQWADPMGQHRRQSTSLSSRASTV